MAPLVLIVILLAGCAATRPAGEPPPQPQQRARPPAAPEQLAKSRPPRSSEPPVRPPAVLRDDDGPLTGKIGPETPPDRATALRMTEEARRRLVAGETARAIELLERALMVDARVPYAYYFLAEAHARADRLGLARSFLDRAQQLLAAEPYWLGRVHALRGLISEQEGKREAARVAYESALRVWPANAEAAAGLARLGMATREGR